MYADKLEGDSKASITERLNGSVASNSIRRRTVTGKRQRQDDKWEHDLFQDERPQLSRKLGGGDLRLKLQRRSSQQETQGGGVRDLREKLSGSMHSQPVNKDSQKPKPEHEAVKPARRSVIVATPVAEPKKVSNPTSRKKTQQKADASVDGFLQSLGLEKYLITFQAEEVDMTALEHMTDEDLKAIGIPMGPRKKILLALSSRG
ncbi:ankyrin repeat and SAM domain-containing protein 6-like isoform X1 [Chenopodium quinoa]|uniref:ankyrin repeat and SAM domain-containing protein 6-like isoform X1 n=1 Tax=Chenopodium quinoa TaxID=63459 RepID=UPI000B7909A7|nr:ankyrin repeat and SAM domain-containing protein 6-like isoform X1 [Chenopodium quinoa]